MDLLEAGELKQEQQKHVRKKTELDRASEL